MSSFSEREVLLEMSMSIGNSLDREAMLKETLTVFLRALNGFAAVVFRCCRQTPVLEFTMPKAAARNPGLCQAAERASILCSNNERFPEPLLVQNDTHYFYAWRLGNERCLILGRSAALPTSLVREIELLARKLQHALVACLQFEQLQQRSREELAQEQEKLAESEQRYRSLFALNPDGVVILEGDTVLDMNGAAGDLLGMARSNAVPGQSFAKIWNDLSADDARELEQQLDSARRGGKCCFELRFRGVDRGWCTAEIRLTSIPIGERGIVQAIVRDITDRKTMEAEILRTRDLAETASAAKGEFLANMSHEIRTPLNGIIGMTGILMSSSLNAEQKRYTELIQRSGDALLGVINDILDYSKIEARKLQLERVEFSLPSVVEDSVELLALKAQEKDLALTCRIEPDVPVELSGDPGRLRQILLNLLGNAIKFTATGGVSLRVERERGAPDAGPAETLKSDQVMLRFSVTDTGVGLQSHELGRLFSPFTQVDGSTTRKYGGTGLGLAISRQLSELMGGKIGVQSEWKKGATFWFTCQMQCRSDKPYDAWDLIPGLSGKQVLILVACPDARTQMCDLVRSWGGRVIEAATAEAAWQAELAEKQSGRRVDIMVVDRQLPDSSGAECVQRRLRNGFAPVPTFLLVPITFRPGQLPEEQLEGLVPLCRPLRAGVVRQAFLMVLGGDIPGFQNSPEVNSEPLPGSGWSGRKARILLAEDNPTNQIVAQIIFKRLGVRADLVGNGKEAVEAVRNIGYDLVFMDCQMPEMDGYEATREIRLLSGEKARVPIIAMTAHAMASAREQCFGAGMNDFVAKPVTLESIAIVLRRWLEPATSEADEIIPAPPKPPVFPPREGEEIWNWHLLVDKLQGDQETARLALGVFLMEFPKQIVALQQALQEGDVQKIQRSAHRLKGSALEMQIESLQTIAAQIEAGPPDDLPGLFHKCQALGRLFQAFQDRALKKPFF